MTISFTNPIQALTYRKVEDYLTTSILFRDALQVATNQPSFYVTYGSALISVEVLAWDVHPWESGDLAIVKACSCVTVDSQVNAALMHYLLLENSRMRFGAFQLGNANEILFAHSVLGGENMDLMELQTCILSVVTIADTYDDIIVEKFGGQRAVDRLM
ncbi:hypothetical protein HJG54_24320 [Leptolyngbya sp. NK1-12]|uniref:TY-Chap central domain-containing protein n=1 Tax=Leptolyngbya sp. NK1-12 TaxID=2547451 RepID=A0AA97AMF1_9CYAN|nr:hypothetical protein [Leptolyngbya sp. NK1-12]WNZ25652.1 hypothetical protein HJG54_24320 [Leptolyngbya sp. NK1-12]